MELWKSKAQPGAPEDPIGETKLKNVNLALHKTI